MDDRRVRTLTVLAATARARGVNMLLVGAFARDLVFWHMHGISPKRKTTDVDATIQVDSWVAYNEFRTALLDRGFKANNAAHPELLVDPDTELDVDLFPFGTIARDGRSVDWQSGQGRWSVVGIQDAYDHALSLRIDSGKDDHIIRFVSVPALVLLKIVASSERPQDRAKRDSADVGFVIDNYLRIGNKQRLERTPHDDIAKLYGMDLDRATACLLGRDMRAMAAEGTRGYLVGLLETEQRSRSLCLFTQGLQVSLCGGNFSRARTIVGDMLAGLKWIPMKSVCNS